MSCPSSFFGIFHERWVLDDVEGYEDGRNAVRGCEPPIGREFVCVEPTSFGLEDFLDSALVEFAYYLFIFVGMVVSVVVGELQVVFGLRLTFWDNYPVKPSRVRFTSEAFHPNG